MSRGRSARRWTRLSLCSARSAPSNRHVQGQLRVKRLCPLSSWYKVRPIHEPTTLDEAGLCSCFAGSSIGITLTTLLMLLLLLVEVVLMSGCTERVVHESLLLLLHVIDGLVAQIEVIVFLVIAVWEVGIAPASEWFSERAIVTVAMKRGKRMKVTSRDPVMIVAFGVNVNYLHVARERAVLLFKTWSHESLITGVRRLLQCCAEAVSR